jgi:hypothetical protein
MKLEKIIEAELSIFTTVFVIWLGLAGIAMVFILSFMATMAMLSVLEVPFSTESFNLYVQIAGMVIMPSLFVMLLAHVITLGMLKIINKFGLITE